MPQIGLFWAEYFRSIYIPEIETFAQCLVDRILPTFNKLEDEASEIEEKENERLCMLSGPDDDGETIAKQAREAGQDHYTRFSSMRQGIVNMFCAGLYHLFEQHIFNIYRLEILGIGKEVKENLTLEIIHKEFLDRVGINIKKMKAWMLIDELRLISNTVKHADGKSSKKLKETKPKLFYNPELAGLRSLRSKPGPVLKPMFGENVYVTFDDFSNYVDALKSFWFELADLIESNYKN
ncbi:MAG: hypothetical protein AB1424_12225 [Thermodesulfobacteriota bacterium]